MHCERTGLNKTWPPHAHLGEQPGTPTDLFTQNGRGQALLAWVQYSRHTISHLVLPVCSLDSAKTPKIWQSSFKRQSQTKTAKSYCGVFNPGNENALIPFPSGSPYESQNTYHPSRGRVLPLCEEIFTLLRSMRMQAASRRGSYRLLKLKGFLQDSIVRASFPVHKHQL